MLYKINLLKELTNVFLFLLESADIMSKLFKYKTEAAAFRDRRHLHLGEKYSEPPIKLKIQLISSRLNTHKKNLIKQLCVLSLSTKADTIPVQQLLFKRTKLIVQVFPE